MRFPQCLEFQFSRLVLAFLLLGGAYVPVSADPYYSGPVKVTEMKLESGNIFAKFSATLANPKDCPSPEWSVFTPLDAADANRIMATLLTAKTMDSDLELLVHDTDCHLGKRRLLGVYLK